MKRIIKIVSGGLGEMSTKTLLSILLLFVALFTVVIFFSGKSDSVVINDAGEYVIEFTEKGYSPQDLNIKIGDTVRFMNLTDRAFWPASNVHPTHGIYSEFDPKQHVEGGESWAFTFDKPGRWFYHDHLYSWFLGRINVSNEDGSLTSSNCNLESLKQGIDPEEGNEQCWENLIYEGMLSGGVKGAFAVFVDIYDSDPDFVASDCHARAHDVGDLAYTIWRQSGDFNDMDIPPESVYCNYGYFHGMIGHMVEENQSPKFLEQLCIYLDENYSDLIPATQATCYHAAGHGLTLPPTDLSMWGNPKALIADALDFCDAIPTSKDNILQCHEGVYNVLTLWTWQNQFGLSPDYNKPLELCVDQSDDLRREACYYEFGMYLTHSDTPTVEVNLVDAAKRHIYNIEDDKIAQTLIHVLVAGEVAQNLIFDDLSHMVEVCNQLQLRLQNSCFKAILGGIVAHGTPGKEHLDGIRFCELDSVKGDKRKICYENLFMSLRWVYNDQKINEMCSLLTPADQAYCYTLDADL